MSKPPDEPPRDTAGETAAVPYEPAPTSGARSRVLAVKERHEAELLDLPGVEGVGVTDDDGQEVIVVYARDEGVAATLPQSLEGVQVLTVVTGPITAQEL